MSYPVPVTGLVLGNSNNCAAKCKACCSFVLGDEKIISNNYPSLFISGFKNSLLEYLSYSSVSELENEKMFGELPLETASKLLEENDFQDVLSRLPDETFDIFTSKFLQMSVKTSIC